MRDTTLFEFLTSHGYTGSYQDFKDQYTRLKERFDQEFKGSQTFIYGESFFKFKPGFFEGCLFGDRVAELIQELYAAHYSNRIIDRRVMKAGIAEMESILQSIDVYDYCGKTEEYQKLLDDDFHRQKDHLPQPRNLLVLKDLQSWILRSMFRYWSIKAEYEAVRMALDLKEFGLIVEHKATIRYTRSTPYIDIYNQYDECNKHFEDDYIFFNASVGQLIKRLIDPPFKLKLFDLARFKPKKQTILTIIEKQIIGGEPFFLQGRDHPQYMLDEDHINPYYHHQIKNLWDEVTKYISSAR